MATQVKTDSPTISGFADHHLPEMLEKAKALQPLLRDKMIEAEELRSPVPEVADRLIGEGFFRMLLPERHGGLALSLSAFAKVQMEIAKGDPSMSWVLQICNGTTWIATLASDAIQDAIFGGEPKIVCGAYNPPGKARKVDGGFLVTGAWPYTSGSRQAEWAQCGILFEGDDVPTAPGISQCYIPFNQIDMVDSWYVTGMQGTGSDTSTVTDVFVPEHLIVTMDKPYGYVEPGKRNYGAASDFLSPVPSVRASGIAQLIGAARRMEELCREESKKKPIVTTTFKTRTESAVVIHELGRVAAMLDNAETLLFAMLEELGGLAEQGIKVPVEVAGRQRAGCAQVIELIHEAIEQIMFISGSSAFMLSNPLQRYWRDVHMALRHIQNNPMVGYEIYGRDLLGIAPNITPAGAY